MYNNVLVEGVTYRIIMNSDKILENLVYKQKVNLNGKDMFCFVDIKHDERPTYLNISYIAGIIEIDTEMNSIIFDQMQEANQITSK
tara:strand:- start:1560 stop:1817 length:258 start_codon:yes stop_codon:yes gene_type:complete